MRTFDFLNRKRKQKVKLAKIQNKNIEERILLSLKGES